MINSKDEWVGHAARMGELSNMSTYKILVGKP
jgi:hypothetical protein